MSAVRSVAIVGRDAPLWLTSLALHRAVAPLGVEITAIELPSLLSDHHAHAASPALNGLHAILGLDRRNVLRAARGMAAGGQRHLGWGPAPYFTGFDGVRPALGGLDILHHWIAARHDGASVPFDRLSLAAAAMAAGRVGADDSDPNRFGTIHRASHLDATAYSAFLRKRAVAAGVAISKKQQIEPRFDGTRLVQIEGTGDRLAPADLYIDVSGSDAVLAGSRPEDDWEDWTAWLPVRRLWWASAPALRPLPPFTELRRWQSGWSARIPLPGRTAILAACADPELEPPLRDAAGTDRISAPTGEPFAAGHRSAWRENVIALGDASCRIEPVDLMSLHLLHAGIVNLLAWWPSGEDESLALRERFNLSLRQQAESARDFQVARYRLGGDLAEGAQSPAWPENLERRIALFSARGQVPVFDGDSFDEGLWFLQLCGLGLVPRTPDPRTWQVDRAERENGLGRLVLSINAAVKGMPTVLEDLGQ